jgi:hypothetical protein
MVSSVSKPSMQPHLRLARSWDQGIVPKDRGPSLVEVVFPDLLYHTTQVPELCVADWPSRHEYTGYLLVVGRGLQPW